jgi:hypothetical protein
LTFGSEFSPSQRSWPFVIKLADMFGNNWKGFEGAVE